MFENKKEKYHSNSNKFSNNYNNTKNNNNKNNIEDELSTFKKNNLFNLINNNDKINDDFLFNNNDSNYSKSKNKAYDYNQEFIKRQNKYSDIDNNDDFQEKNDYNETIFSSNRESDEISENQNKSKSIGLFGNFGIQTNNDYTTFKNNNPSTEVNKYGIAVNISNYETKMSGVEESVYFKIDLYSKLSNKSWSVSHKYMEFFELNLIFEKYYVSPPFFMGQGSMMTTDGVSDIMHKKTLLNQYIKEVCNRSDLMTSIYCVKFLKLENHYELLMSYYPKELYYFKDQLVLPISVSYFLEQANLLFIGCGKQYKTVFNNIMDKVKSFSPFNFSGSNQKQLKLKKNTQVKGQFVIINIIKNFKNKYLFEPLYAKPLYTECSSMNFFKDKSCLTIGMYDGSVNIYKIFINETTPETQGNLVIEAGIFQAHLKPIVGTVVNFINGYIYTLARECVIKIFDINYQNLVKSVPMTVKPMTSMHYDEKSKILIIGDEMGRFYFVDVFEDPVFPSILKTYQGGTNSNIICIYLTNDKETMIASNKTGVVNIYSIYGFNSRNKISIEKNKTMYVSKKYEINDIKFTERGELLLAMDNGSVLVYYKGTDNIEFVIDAHLYSIGNIFVVEDKHALISTSEDRSIRMVEFPAYYPGQMIRRELTNLNHVSIKNKIENSRKNDYYHDSINKNNDNDIENNDRNDIKDYDDDYNDNYSQKKKNNNDYNMINNDNYIDNKNEDKYMNYYQIMIIEPINKSYKTIFSDDLDGWDDEIEEYL